MAEALAVAAAVADARKTAEARERRPPRKAGGGGAPALTPLSPDIMDDTR